MVLLVIAVTGGLIAGLIRAPQGPHTARIRLHRIWLLALGALLNAGSVLSEGDASTIVLGASLVCLLTFSAANVHVTGVAVIGLGLLLNLAALVLNNGMPVRPASLVAADVVESSELAGLTVDPPRHLETDADPFGWLGDVVPVPVAREVLSFGDLIVVVGAADAVRDLARRRRRPRDHRETDHGAGAAEVRIDLDAEATRSDSLAPAGSPS